MEAEKTEPSIVLLTAALGLAAKLCSVLRRVVQLSRVFAGLRLG